MKAKCRLLLTEEHSLCSSSALAVAGQLAIINAYISVSGFGKFRRIS